MSDVASQASMERHFFEHDGLRLSYLDAGGDAPIVIALPAHWMEAVTYAPVAAALAPAWRVVALDQRGHGHSDHPSVEGGYTRAAYLGDIEALFTHLGVGEAVLLGNSLGGVNAFQLAARRPARVRALVVEDIGAVIGDDVSFVLAWEGTFPSRAALADAVGARFLPYLQDAFRETSDGWRLAFDPRAMLASQAELNGDHWADWLASNCPALLLRGGQSRVTSAPMLEEMAARRPHTRLLTLNAGHVVHMDDLAGFAATVRAFLDEL